MRAAESWPAWSLSQPARHFLLPTTRLAIVGGQPAVAGRAVSDRVEELPEQRAAEDIRRRASGASSLVPIPRVSQERIHGGGERLEILGSDPPENVAVDRVILVAKYVADGGDVGPR